MARFLWDLMGNVFMNIFMCITHIYLCMYFQLVVRISFISSVHGQQMFQINSNSWNSDALDRNWTPHQASNHSSVSGNHYTSATYMCFSMTQKELQNCSHSLNYFRSLFSPVPFASQPYSI